MTPWQGYVAKCSIALAAGPIAEPGGDTDHRPPIENLTDMAREIGTAMASTLMDEGERAASSSGVDKGSAARSYLARRRTSVGRKSAPKNATLKELDAGLGEELDIKEPISEARGKYARET